MAVNNRAGCKSHRIDSGQVIYRQNPLLWLLSWGAGWYGVTLSTLWPLINSCILSYPEIGLCRYLTKQEKYLWDCCVKDSLQRCHYTPYPPQPPRPPVSSPQNDIPPYETRITTAKLLIESEEYEVKTLLVFCAVCFFAAPRSVWHLGVCERLYTQNPF